jgi:hypothetical protein
MISRETRVSGQAVNTHEQLKFAGGGVAIVVTRGGARTDYVNGYGVYRLDAGGKVIPTRPGAPWYDYGKKVFLSSMLNGNFHERQRAALAKAQQWVAAQGWYDGEWARNRSGDYVPAEINKRFPLRVRKRATL